MYSASAQFTNNNLRGVRRQIEKEAQRLNRAIAEETAEIAKSLAPVKTGALRDSIHVETKRGQSEVIADVEYAAAVEFGGTFTAPHPFMLPAREMVIKEIAAGRFKLRLR